eukprot:1179786-Prorocentrum_minimum.AAC.3
MVSGQECSGGQRECCGRHPPRGTALFPQFLRGRTFLRSRGDLSWLRAGSGPTLSRHAPAARPARSGSELVGCDVKCEGDVTCEGDLGGCFCPAVGLLLGRGQGGRAAASGAPADWPQSGGPRDSVAGHDSARLYHNSTNSRNHFRLASAYESRNSSRNYDTRPGVFTLTPPGGSRNS